MVDAKSYQNGQWIDLGWNPTPEAFERYLVREVEMAKEKVRNIIPEAAHDFAALHSSTTIVRAQAELRAEKP